jgi:two-component system, NtrC family, phosphoglycerate transport system response regulator PgtA
LLTKSIAIVDDNVDIANLFKDVLEDDGYTVFAFNDPVVALNYIQENAKEFGLVISDYRMSRMNGYELCMKLIHLNSDLQVILISAYDLLERDNPTFTFLHKPISIAKLVSVVNEAISKSMSDVKSINALNP